MMLYYLIVAHFLCDYPLQGEFLAKAKNHLNPIAGFPWQHALLAHAIIQGGAVALITGSPALGILEALCHAVIDYLKCDNRINIDVDQILHIICKLIWFLMVPK